MDITIGADPELFVVDTETGKFVSAWGMIPGDKRNPFPVNKGAIQVDGNAVEFNIDPARTEDEFVENITTVLGQLRECVKEKKESYDLVFEPVAHFDLDEFLELPVEARTLGCDPDFDYRGRRLDPPNIMDTPLRTGSGHVHIGIKYQARLFESAGYRKLFGLGNHCSKALLKVARGWENQSSKERRKYYGMKGACRLKPYGIELRALDNLWLKSEDTMREVYRTAYSSALEYLTKEN